MIGAVIHDMLHHVSQRVSARFASQVYVRDALVQRFIRQATHECCEIRLDGCPARTEGGYVRKIILSEY
jgi:hypothetical protein